MVIGFLLLLPIAIWKGVKRKSTGFELPLTGLLLGGGFVCYALSFLLTDVVRALILFYMSPIWTTIFETLFLKKKTWLGKSFYLDFSNWWFVDCV